jgi:hypothetical protein
MVLPISFMLFFCTEALSKLTSYCTEASPFGNKAIKRDSMVKLCFKEEEAEAEAEADEGANDDDNDDGITANEYFIVCLSLSAIADGVAIITNVYKINKVVDGMKCVTAPADSTLRPKLLFSRL